MKYEYGKVYRLTELIVIYARELGFDTCRISVYLDKNEPDETDIIDTKQDVNVLLDFGDQQFSIGVEADNAFTEVTDTMAAARPALFISPEDAEDAHGN